MAILGEGVLLKVSMIVLNNLDMKTTTPYQNQQKKALEV
jgi:hypothetical protein